MATLPLYTAEDTHFDAPWRSSDADLARARQRLLAHPDLAVWLEALPNAALVLDENRQIVALNARAGQLFGADTIEAVLGQRMGEALACVHAHEMPAGCGTSRFCQECGAGQVLQRSSRPPVADANECRITAVRDGREVALDLRVHVAPLTVGGDGWLLCVLEDIADEKRREALERIFFHDVLNTATALQGSTRLLEAVESVEEVRALGGPLRRAAQQVVHEIQAQRDLLSAERGDLFLTLETLPANSLALAVQSLYAGSREAAGRLLLCEPAPHDLLVRTDRVQAVRSLGNLVKNALEATAPGGTVTVRVENEATHAAFHVHNDAAIPEAHQLQIFQRSFSSKGAAGRGLGTYSVRLIVEQSLGGRVGFTSSPTEGTTFTMRLPTST